MSGILLEVCVDTAAGLRAAIDGGADRIELCAALDVGGITPSAGLMMLASRAAVPVRALIRPRSGDFVYDDAEHDMMLRDIDAARAAGMAGVVIGATTRDDDLDVATLRALCDRAAGMEVALHRAIDMVRDPVPAVEIAVRLGIATILTSGSARTASLGAATIAAMHHAACGRIEILAGSGVDAATVADLVQATGVRAVHASCSGVDGTQDPRTIALGFASQGGRRTDPARVAVLRATLDRFDMEHAA